jgi:TPR repeat protein
MSSRAGIAAGNQYGLRISPQYVWVGREYYRKAHKMPEMKQAARLAKFQNWESAMKIWEKLAKSSDPKVARRASFNMALVAEHTGELDLALEWANRAAQLGDRRAPRYIQILQQRKWDQQRLEEQMRGKK